MNSLEQAITSYQMPDEARKLLLEHPSLNIAGPTGAGKGTMALHLTQTGQFVPVVSDTTRKQRPFANGYEVNGVRYWFIDEHEALDKLAHTAYIEAKLVHGDTLYGTSIAAYKKVIDSGHTPILEIDVQGMEDLMRAAPGFQAILLLPPSFEIWENRIDGRGDMDIEQKIRRFKSALVEYAKPFENDNFYPVINTEVIETAEVIKSGAYHEKAYRTKALALLVELQAATKEFLSTHNAI